MEISEKKQGIPVPTTTRKRTTEFDDAYKAMEALSKDEMVELKPVVKAGLKNPLGNLVYNLRKYAKTSIPNKTFVVKVLENQPDTVGVWCTDEKQAEN